MKGLTRATDEDLVKLLRAIVRGDLVCPLRRVDLLVSGMNRLAEEADPLFGLDSQAVQVAIRLVLAERKRFAKQPKA